MVVAVVIVSFCCVKFSFFSKYHTKCLAGKNFPEKISFFLGLDMNL